MALIFSNPYLNQLLIPKTYQSPTSQKGGVPKLENVFFKSGLKIAENDFL